MKLKTIKIIYWIIVIFGLYPIYHGLTTDSIIFVFIIGATLALVYAFNILFERDGTNKKVIYLCSKYAYILLFLLVLILNVFIR